MNDEINETLLKLTDGLLYISESDYELDLADWGIIDDEAILKKIAAIAGIDTSLVERQDADTFFNKTIEALDPADEYAAELAKQYKELHDYIRSTFAATSVYRAGKIHVHIFIVCKTNAGHCFALHTVSVET